eukprot:1843260-Prymnesium_polylepis.1
MGDELVAMLEVLEEEARELVRSDNRCETVRPLWPNVGWAEVRSDDRCEAVRRALPCRGSSGAPEP